MNARRIPVLLKQSEVQRLAPSIPEIVAMMEQAYRVEAEGEADVPAKIGAHPKRPNSFLHAMPAWIGSPASLGAKIVTYYPGNFARGFEDSTAVILLYDPDNGQLVSIMEGMWITFVRTVACAAVAAKLLANPMPRSLGLVGCGGLGEWTLRIMTAIFPSISDVAVSSRRPDSRAAFCARHSGESAAMLRPVESTREAVEGMDVVVSSTPQQSDPRLFERWWSPGTLAIPFDYPFAWDDDAYRKCDILAVDGFATLTRHEESSRAGRTRPNFRLPSNTVSLQHLMTGRVAGRTTPSDRVLAIVTGIASTDLILAEKIFRRAREEKLGTEIALF